MLSKIEKSVRLNLKLLVVIFCKDKFKSIYIYLHSKKLNYVYFYLVLNTICLIKVTIELVDMLVNLPLKAICYFARSIKNLSILKVISIILQVPPN